MEPQAPVSPASNIRAMIAAKKDKKVVKKSRAEATKVKEKENAQLPADKKQSTAFKIEQARLEHQLQQAEAQRAHELKMLDKQIELERLRMGSNITPAGHMYPRAGPPPDSWIDPLLSQ